MRRLDCVPRRLGCKNCSCGNHRGCVKRSPPPWFNGAHVPYQYVFGEAKEDCPCIKADDDQIRERKRQLKAEKKAVQEKEAAQEKEEKSLRIRISAIEKALWGKTFEGKVILRRPALVSRKEPSEQTVLGKRKRENAKSKAK